jgi:hypothetical protein
MTDDASWEEQVRQTGMLAKAIHEAIEETASEFDAPPILNALAGALVSIQAEVLAMVPEERARQALREVMLRELAKALEMVLARQRDEILFDVCVIVSRGPKQ